MSYTCLYGHEPPLCEDVARVLFGPGAGGYNPGPGGRSPTIRAPGRPIRADPPGGRRATGRWDPGAREGAKLRLRTLLNGVFG